MAIIDSNSDIRKWYYDVKAIKFFYTDENNNEHILETVPRERLKNMNILEDFENTYFPVFSLTLVLEDSTYYNILEHKDSCKLYLRVDKFSRKSGESAKQLNRRFINRKFDVIIEDNSFDVSSKIDELENLTNFTSITDSDKNELKDVTNIVKFYLFPEILGNTKKNVNKPFKDASVTEALAWLFYNAKINNVLMARTDNNTRYDELVIPPLSTLKALAFIDTYYGLYKYGSLIYFGLFYNYVIPYDGSNHVVPKSGDTKVEIDFIVPDTDSTNQTGVMHSGKNNAIDYIVTNFRNISSDTVSIGNDFINGNNIQIIDAFEEVSEIYRSNSKTRFNADFVKFFENFTENKFLPYTYIAQVNALSDVISMQVSDIDASIVLPHKRIKLIFENHKYAKQYRGKYVLSSILHTFTSTGAELSVSSNITLKKMNLKV